MLALLRGLEFELERFKIEKKGIESIFIGGGTPSTISSNLYKDIFQTLKPFLKENIEITAEANPNSASISWLKGMFELGVNRVSFGVQSFRDEKLKILNRAHSSKEAKRAVLDARKVGFKNISIDLIYGLYSDTKENLKEDINIAFSLPINHISTYELTIENDTKFFNTPNIKREDENLGYFIRDEIVKRGFEWYEVSNYGEYKSTHNLGYWRLKNYIGVGAGAVGFKDNKRFYPNNDILEYIKNPTYTKIEELTREDILTEKIFLGLRSKIGIKREILTLDMQKKANILVKKNRLKLENGVYKNKNLFLSDELALFLIE
jgi:oxygen-independent coproporphyrinogen-3 oxidase